MTDIDRLNAKWLTANLQFSRKYELFRTLLLIKMAKKRQTKLTDRFLIKTKGTEIIQHMKVQVNIVMNVPIGVENGDSVKACVYVSVDPVTNVPLPETTTALSPTSSTSSTTSTSSSFASNVSATTTVNLTIACQSTHPTKVPSDAVFPKNKNNRAFQPQWQDKYPWIEYLPSKDAVFCFACRPFGMSDDNWKAALDANKEFPRHDSSVTHKNCMASWEEKKNIAKCKSVSVSEKLTLNY